MNQNAYLYLLHFNVPLEHASHYSGTTCSLSQRLLAHATGAGSRLCRELMARGLHWQLGALAGTAKATARRLERMMKNSHNLSRYCSLCTLMPSRVPETIPIDLANVNCPTSSLEYKSLPIDLRHPDVKVRFTKPGESRETALWIKSVMGKDRDALGFIPVGGEQGLQFLIDRGQIAIATLNHQYAGYCAFTMNRARDGLTVQQCCTEDGSRLCGVGRSMVDAIQQAFPVDARCAVGDDLNANEFWRAIGFTFVGQERHKTSGRMLNHYRRDR